MPETAECRRSRVSVMEESIALLDASVVSLSQFVDEVTGEQPGRPKPEPVGAPHPNVANGPTATHTQPALGIHLDAWPMELAEITKEISDLAVRLRSSLV